MVHELVAEKGIESALQYLRETLSIQVKVVRETDASGKDGIYMLNYSQIDTPRGDDIAQMCRSLMINERGETVSRKLNRFFNYGEMLDITGKIDLTTCSVEAKEDGSLIGFWFDHVTSRWNISTRTMAYADNDIRLKDNSISKFQDLVLETLGLRDLGSLSVLMAGLDTKHTYVFEFCHPQTRVVTPYERGHLFLITIVENSTAFRACEMSVGNKMDFLNIIKERGALNVSQISSFALDAGVDSLIEYVNKLPGLREGVVLRNVHGERLKLKSTTYLTAHRIRGEGQEPLDKDLLELVRSGEVHEFVAYFPEWKERLDKMQATIDKAVTEMMVTFEKAQLTFGTHEDKRAQAKATASVVMGSHPNKPATTGVLFQSIKYDGTIKQNVSRLGESAFLNFYQEWKD